MAPKGENAMNDETTPEWLTTLLTEVSALLYGNGNLASLRDVVMNVPREHLGAAGLRWALSSFDDHAPTRAQMEAAEATVRQPFKITPRSENPNLRSS